MTTVHYYAKPQLEYGLTIADDDDDGEDDMKEIDLDNVVGRRTRGRVIDFAKAAEQLPAEDDEDEDEDDDFEDPDDKMDED